MSLRAETVAVTDDVWEEVMKHTLLSIFHSPEQSFVGILGELLSSGISRTIETKPDHSADEGFNSLFVWCRGIAHHMEMHIVAWISPDTALYVQIIVTEQ